MRSVCDCDDRLRSDRDRCDRKVRPTAIEKYDRGKPPLAHPRPPPATRAFVIPSLVLWTPWGAFQEPLRCLMDATRRPIFSRRLAPHGKFDVKLICAYRQGQHFMTTDMFKQPRGSPDRKPQGKQEEFNTRSFLRSDGICDRFKCSKQNALRSSCDLWPKNHL